MIYVASRKRVDISWSKCPKARPRVKCRCSMFTQRWSGNNHASSRVSSSNAASVRGEEDGNYNQKYRRRWSAGGQAAGEGRPFRSDERCLTLADRGSRGRAADDGNAPEPRRRRDTGAPYRAPVERLSDLDCRSRAAGLAARLCAFAALSREHAEAAAAAC